MKKISLSYKLYKLANEIIDTSIFNKLKQSLEHNAYLKKYSSKIILISKNNTVILLIKFKNIQSIDQIALEFDQIENQISYNINVYCKQGYMDNKFYYPIENILNKSTKNFQITETIQEQLIKYFNEMFNNYFSIYMKNHNNGLYT